MLKLSFNQLYNVDFLRENRFYTNNLTALELDQNKIKFIADTDFEFNQNLTFLNLNSNPLVNSTFNNLNFLTTLKLSNTKISRLTLSKSLKELDLSHLSNSSLSNLENLHKIERINLANAKINISFETFLSNLTRYVDFSYNPFTWQEFKMFNVLGASLETLILKETNLQQIEQIHLYNLVNLRHLDLSFNNLSEIDQNSFEYATNIEYLDLSSNRIQAFRIVLTKLRFLNLENNQIYSTSETLIDYASIETFIMGNNRLETYPTFEMTEIDLSQDLETFLQIDLSQNRFSKIKYFSFIFGKLFSANFDSNHINSIESDAFLNCRSLEWLSIAQNRLSKIVENNFHYLFSLTHLNLSFNRIEFIENASFKNLNKLKTLDLNYNRLVSIENDLFVGLVNVRDLYLIMGNSEMIFYKKSFKHLPNVSTIYVNESLIVKYKCLFMHELDRDVQRNVSNKYIFYKSINFITQSNNSFNSSPNVKCDLVFHLFQFKLHLNLKSDYENDLFFEACQKSLIRRENSFNHNYRKCFQAFVMNEDGGDEVEEAENVHSFRMIFSDCYFWLTIGLLLFLLAPITCLIFRVEFISQLIAFFCQLSSNKQLELEIVKKRRNLERKLRLDLVLKIDCQNRILRSKELIHKDKYDLFNLEKKHAELKSQQK
jgi:Leucine-rich repeat (LRR) protein